MESAITSTAGDVFFHGGKSVTRFLKTRRPKSILAYRLRGQKLAADGSAGFHRYRKVIQVSAFAAVIWWRPSFKCGLDFAGRFG